MNQASSTCFSEPGNLKATGHIWAGVGTTARPSMLAALVCAVPFSRSQGRRGKSPPNHLGSGLVGHRQKIMVAARAWRRGRR
jgi:hypothetical protein